MIKYNSLYKCLVEENYEIKKEAHHATLFTTGNGYFGVRGSFEEFGSLNVQGTFIRGLYDRVIEIPNIYIDNIYMRKYYFNEQKAKQFEYQDSCINIPDFLLVRFQVGEKVFYPWEGKIISWTRYIDIEDGSLIRKVLWDDGLGNQSEITYKRMASFDDQHVYLMSCTLKKINHELPCKILSGIDLLVKTNGQKKTNLIRDDIKNNNYMFNLGDFYNMDCFIGYNHSYSGINEDSIIQYTKDNCYIDSVEDSNSNEISLRKVITVYGSMDFDKEIDLFEFGVKENRKNFNIGYDSLYKNHVKAYKSAFNKIKVCLDSNPEDEAYLNYANYQTLIGVNHFDAVHSLSAKNLTGQKYNQFVWWDAEIYQFPIYLMTMPKIAKNVLMYRYNRLDESKKNAEKDGYLGAKFAFCSSVKGDEKVWEYARHPFMQIHINADIGHAIIQYYNATKDEDFLKNYGIEMLYEISKYYLSRSKWNSSDNCYEILQVTGTDEHHPYVDNNAYTNYLTSYVVKKMVKYLTDYPMVAKRLGINQNEIDKFLHYYTNLKKPVEGNLIPQFDGYLSLSKKLEVTGNGIAKGFQMKESGLYQLSQVIKQPDVLMLYTYLNLEYEIGNYKENWQYYEPLCEASSSLTYPVHGIASIDHLEYDKFHDYFNTSIKIDIIDKHNEAHLGLHAASMAGGWYLIFRGLFGLVILEDGIQFNPKYLANWGRVSLDFYYLNKKVTVISNKSGAEIISDQSIKIYHKDKTVEHKKYTHFNWE